MAKQANNSVGIKESWGLIDFAKSHGKMSVAPCRNQKTNEEFKSCVFNNDGNLTFVAFSSNLGVLTPQEIAAQKDDLQVVQLENDKYKLCKKSGASWEDVDLGL